MIERSQSEQDATDPGAAPSVALVTGAGRGIGRAVAEQLSAHGLKVVLSARTESQLNDAASACSGDTMTILADMRRQDDIDALFARAEAAWGPIDVLVANAGAAVSGPVAETTDEDWQLMLEVNLTGPFRCIRRAAPSMAVTRPAFAAGVRGSACRRARPRRKGTSGG